MTGLDSVARLNAALADRYVLEREIGAGGMATVYLARDLRHDRRVALKLLKPELGAVLGADRFLNEIRVTANLQHPNLLPLFDSGEAEGLLFYVMPYVEGESLRARLDREGQLPLPEVIHIAAAIASALDSAHRHGVVHRDLKPENVLMHEGEPLVADFGIALAVSNAGGERVTQTGLSLGTPQYMSPEQATGDRVIDRRSDVYALGAMTYEMIVGEPPHTGANAQAIIARLLTEQPRRPQAMRPSVPDSVEDTVMRALEKLPADRWQTAAAFADALQSGTSGAYSGSRQSAKRPSGIRARMHDTAFLAAAGAAIVAALIAGAGWGRPRARPVTEPVIRFPLAIPRSAAVWNAVRGTLAISPDGRTVAFVGTGPMGLPVLMVRPLRDLQARVLAGTEGAEQPFFSPDGRWLGFWAVGKLQKVPIDGGAPVTLATMPMVNGASWSSSGVIVTTRDLGLVTVPENGGPIKPLSTPATSRGEYGQVFPIVLPDGETVLYVSQREINWRTGRIGVASLSRGDVTITDVSGTSPLAYVDGSLIFASAPNLILGVSFDLKARRATGAPTQLLGDVSIASAGVVDAAVSGDGSLVYQSESHDARMLSVDLRGTSRPIVEDVRPYANPRFAPRGRRIAVTIGSGARSDIWLIDLATHGQSRLTTEGTNNDRPEWAPDGQRVLYRSDRSGTSAIWWQTPDAAGTASPLLGGKSNYYEAVMSPDARTIAYQMDDSAALIGYRFLAGDTTPHFITTSRIRETMPRISPDGRWLAYVTRSSGTSEVVVQPFPGSGGAVQVSNRGGSEPVWSRDGRRLYYRDGRSLIEAELQFAPPLAVRARRALFADAFSPSTMPHANYDVSPDGKEFLFVEVADRPQLVVVRNWMSEVRGQMTARR